MLGVAAQAYARASGRPAELFTVPGLALLVPGSFGVRSMAALLSEQTTVGVETAFHMVLTAMALATGLLASSMFDPQRLRDPRHAGRPAAFARPVEHLDAAVGPGDRPARRPKPRLSRHGPCRYL